MASDCAIRLDNCAMSLLTHNVLRSSGSGRQVASLCKIYGCPSNFEHKTPILNATCCIIPNILKAKPFFWSLVPCKQDSHLKGRHFQIKFTNLILECDLHRDAHTECTLQWYFLYSYITDIVATNWLLVSHFRKEKLQLSNT